MRYPDPDLLTNRFEVFYEDGRIMPVKTGYAPLHASIEPASGETVWLVTVGYTTGDSFGRQPDTQFEFVDLYRTEDEAIEVAKAIRAHQERTRGLGSYDNKITYEDRHTMAIRFGNGVDRTMHLPWAGYFEHLEFIEVREMVVGGPSRRRF